MDFSAVADDTAVYTTVEVEYILSLNISPQNKRLELTKIFSKHGRFFFKKLFDANSKVFDSTTIGTNGFQNPNDQVETLAAKLVQNYYLNREIAVIVKAFYDSVLAQAGEEAFKNAISLDKHPTIQRFLSYTSKKGPCDFCRTLANKGAVIYPDRMDFARHDDCHCTIKTSGFNSRNGKLKNYIKVDGRKRTIAGLKADGYTNAEIQAFRKGIAT